MTVKQADGVAASHVGVDQAFREVGQKFVQPQKFVTLAHPLAVAVHQHQNGAFAPMQYGIQDVV